MKIDKPIFIRALAELMVCTQDLDIDASTESEILRLLSRIQHLLTESEVATIEPENHR